jgi:transcriptional regulator with XRE-family HTH domain
MPTPLQFKYILHERGLSQKVVSKEIGVTPQLLNSFLNGRISGLKKSKQYRLCNLLGIDILF